MTDTCKVRHSTRLKLSELTIVHYRARASFMATPYNLPEVHKSQLGQSLSVLQFRKLDVWSVSVLESNLSIRFLQATCGVKGVHKATSADSVFPRPLCCIPADVCFSQLFLD